MYTGHFRDWPLRKSQARLGNGSPTINDPRPTPGSSSGWASDREEQKEYTFPPGEPTSYHISIFFENHYTYSQEVH